MHRVIITVVTVLNIFYFVKQPSRYNKEVLKLCLDIVPGEQAVDDLPVLVWAGGLLVGLQHLVVVGAGQDVEQLGVLPRHQGHPVLTRQD
jgi:hypothetical protein